MTFSKNKLFGFNFSYSASLLLALGSTKKVLTSPMFLKVTTSYKAVGRTMKAKARSGTLWKSQKKERGTFHVNIKKLLQSLDRSPPDPACHLLPFSSQPNAVG